MIGFISCGGGTTSPASSNEIEMVLNKTYIISKGQSIVKKSDNARVLLSSDIKTGETKATLKSGKCAIVLK